MVDFQNMKYLKLRKVRIDKFQRNIEAMLIPDETIVASFQAVRDYVVFTSHRLMLVNVQGLTGTKQDFTSLPYRRVNAYSVETAGILDLDSELDLWFSGLAQVHLEFTGGTDVAAICRIISERML